MNTAINRLSARWTLRRAVQVQGRGKASAEWSRRLGIESTIDVPDLSFGMRVPLFDAVAARIDIVRRLRDQLVNSDRLPVGVAPNAIVYQKARRAGIDYVAFLASIVRELEGMGLFPVLIPHSYRSDTTTLHNNDRAICHRVLELLPTGTTCFYLDGDLDARDLRSVISRLHLLIASRFHSMVSALATGVPPITLGWGGHKYKEVLEQFGLDELYTPYTGLSIERVRRTLETSLSDRECLARRIREALPHVTRRTGQVPHLIVQTLTER